MVLTLIALQRYFELSQQGDAPIPLNSETVRSVCVWER